MECFCPQYGEKLDTDYAHAELASLARYLPKTCLYEELIWTMNDSSSYSDFLSQIHFISLIAAISTHEDRMVPFSGRYFCSDGLSLLCELYKLWWIFVRRFFSLLLLTNPYFFDDAFLDGIHQVQL